MANYAIAPWGSDSWAGSLAKPFATQAPVQALIDAHTITTGDTIFVFGTNTWAAGLQNIPAGVTVRGASYWHRPTINIGAGVSGLSMASAGSNIILQWLKIVGGANCIAFGDHSVGSKVRGVEVSGWTNHGIDGNTGTNCHGNQVTNCEIWGGDGDGFSTGSAYDWLIQDNYIHDITGPGGTDGIAFHDSNVSKNVVKRNRVENVAPTVGKAGISCGSTGSGGGSWVEADGNIIINCGNFGIMCGPVSAAAFNPNGRLLAKNNIVVTSQSSALGCLGIGVLQTNDARGPQIFNNLVVNRYTYATSGTDISRSRSYGLDCAGSGQTVRPYFFNNVSILELPASQLHWYISLQYFVGAFGYAATGDLLVNNNCYYPDGSDVFNSAASVLDFASVQALLLGADANSICESPRYRSSLPTKLADFFIDRSSPLIGAGADESAIFTNDRFGITRTVPWSIGPSRGFLPSTTEEQAYEMICQQAQLDSIQTLR